MLSFSPNIKISQTKKFLSTKEASEIVSYSREYIGRLAREQKIKAQWQGGKWLINSQSLCNFYQQAKIEEDILTERLRNERLAEQNLAEFFFGTKNYEARKLSTAQFLLMHLVSAVSLGVILMSSSFVIFKFDNISQLAQLFNLKQTEDSKQMTVLKVVEVTNPIDITNGILLFPLEATSTIDDPTLFFSDEVELRETKDGQKFLHFYNGDDFSNIPIIRIPTQTEYYQEVTNTTDQEPFI